MQNFTEVGTFLAPKGAQYPIISLTDSLTDLPLALAVILQLSCSYLLVILQSTCSHLAVIFQLSHSYLAVIFQLSHDYLAFILRLSHSYHAIISPYLILILQ